MLLDQVAAKQGEGVGVPAVQNLPSGQGRPVTLSFGVRVLAPAIGESFQLSNAVINSVLL